MIAFVRQLAQVYPEASEQQALHCLANSSVDITRSAPSNTAKSNRTESHTHTSQCRLTAVHQANVRMCRATVTMVRRLALAPVRHLLDQVPQLPVWSAVPGSGECTLPSLAYLPQDYMTQV